MLSLIFLIFLPVLCSCASSCTTPLGARSECISLYNCKALVAAFEQRPLPSDVISFLRKSQCGFEGSTPLVCCGPLPSQRPQQRPTQRPRPTQTRPVSGGVDPVNSADSSPAPPGACGVETNGDRIFGGQFTELDEFPWMALLGYRTKQNTLSYQCGGVLINERYVMTAAHCVVGEVETKVGSLETVRLGEYDTQNEIDCLDDVCADPPQEINVQRKIPHPGYSEGNQNRKDDIAIVRLAKRVRYTYYVQPICLAGANQRLDAGSSVFVAGWGKTLSGRNSPVKLKLNLPIFNKEECKNKYKNYGALLTDNQLCAGGNFAEDACRGDSGSPLMRRTPEGVWEAIGVVSFGNGCGNDGWPGVYSAVSKYRKWIENTLRQTNV